MSGDLFTIDITEEDNATASHIILQNDDPFSDLSVKQVTYNTKGSISLKDAGYGNEYTSIPSAHNEFMSLKQENLLSTTNGEITPNHNNLLSENDLKQKALLLSKREKELNKKELELQNKLNNNNYNSLQSLFTLNKDSMVSPNQFNNNNTTKLANWPIKDSKYFSLLYHSIENEIPIEFQELVQKGYKTWMLISIGLLFNFITISYSSFIDNFYNTPVEKGSNVFSTLLWLIIGIPILFLFWYLNLYKLAIQIKTSYWIIFNILSYITGIVSILILSGTPWYPCAGLFFSLTCLFTGKYISFILSIINSLQWLIALFYGLNVYNNTKLLYNNYFYLSNKNTNKSPNNISSLSNINIVVDALSNFK